MAITIVTTPDKYAPIFNPVVFQLTTTNYAQPNFKFVADVYSGSGVLIASLKYQPQVIGTNPIFIDISKVLLELVSSDYLNLNYTQASIVTSGGAISGYSVQFGEQYGGVVYANLISYTGYAFNASINNLRFAYYASPTYLNSKFLTQFNRQTVRKRDSLMISIMQSDLTPINNFTYTFYDINGSVLTTQILTNPYQSLVTVSNRVLHLAVGFNYLAGILSLSAGVQANSAYYIITTGSTASFRVDLFSKCERFPGLRLHFLNELGGFDAFNFMLDTKRKQTTERKSYQAQPANIQTGFNVTTKKFEAITRNFDTKYTEKATGISDYLYDSESKLLAELLSSSLVYEEVDSAKYGGTGTVLIPINVTTLDYEIKKAQTDKLFNLELEIEYTTPNYRQVI